MQDCASTMTSSIRSCSPAIATARTITTTQKGRYDSTATLDEIKQYNVQWLNSVDVGHGNIGAGVDWQKQSTEPGTNYVTNGYDLRNTGVS
jgi:outer membrane cobalamin receptor